MVEVVSKDRALGDGRVLYALVQWLAGRIAAGLDVPAAATPAPRALPTDALTWYSRGLLHLQRGERAEAAAAFERALQASPDFPEAREGLRQVRPT